MLNDRPRVHITWRLNNWILENVKSSQEQTVVRIPAVARTSCQRIACYPAVPLGVARAGRVNYTTHRASQFEDFPEGQLVEDQESEGALAWQNPAVSLPAH